MYRVDICFIFVGFGEEKVPQVGVECFQLKKHFETTTRLHPQGKGGPKVSLCWIIRASFESGCTRILFLSPPNSVQNGSNLDKKCIFLIRLYMNSIPESAKNRISNCSNETL